MVKQLLGYICLAGAAVSFATMWLIPKIRRQRGASHYQGETLSQFEEFVIGKTIKAVENWDVGPTFMFTDGSSLELYTQKRGLAWVLEEGEKQC